MYSYEERMKAVELYIKYDHRVRTVIRELGYPSSRQAVVLWYQEYMKTGELHDHYKKSQRYTQEKKSKRFNIMWSMVGVQPAQ